MLQGQHNGRRDVHVLKLQPLQPSHWTRIQARDETRRALETMEEREREFNDAFSEALVGFDEIVVGPGDEPVP